MSYVGNNAIEIEPVETDNIGSLASLMIAQLPECDDLLVRQELGRALREFCRETNACVLTLPSEAVRIEGTGDFAFPVPPAPQDMIVGTVLGVTMRGVSVPFEVCDVPCNRAMVKVCGYVDCKDVAAIRFSVVPKVGGERCPKWFKERYAEAIVAGAMHHLMSMQKRAWSDPQKAAEYGAKFVDAIGEASYRSLGSQLGGGETSMIPTGGLFM